MKRVEINNIPVCMIPYQFHQKNIKEWSSEFNMQEYIAFCHMSIPNSICSYQRDNKSKMERKFESEENVNYLSNFKRVFSGHFHHHHFVTPTVCYVLLFHSNVSGWFSLATSFWGCRG
jgi:hypothetical protein